MPSANYLVATHAPTREELDQTPGLVVLEFGTSWCGFCRATAPHVELLVLRHPAVKHVQVEDGPGRPLGRSFRVKLWPSFVFLKDGVVVRQLARPGVGELEAAFEAFAGR